MCRVFSFFAAQPTAMKQSFFQGLAKVNKAVLPSFTKQGLDLAKAKKWQLALVGYRYYVTCQALG
jgi:hypothetical protein